MASRRTRLSALMQRLNPLVPMPPDGVEADPALGLDVQRLDPHGNCTPASATRDGNQHTVGSPAKRPRFIDDDDNDDDDDDDECD
ncbi:hypothetical protein M885DRAFT_578103 [Pelagophyceae sp. CCMP2097]|nr:hypothetical protein M885DRAFT_578103 [Pelagophyceae sp. CCMP2097]